MFFKIFFIFGLIQVALNARIKPKVRYEFNLSKDKPEVKFFVEEGLKEYLSFMKEFGYEGIKADKCNNWNMEYSRLKIVGDERQYFIKVLFDVEGSPIYPGSPDPVVQLQCDINAKTDSQEPITSYCFPIFKLPTLEEILKRREDMKKLLESDFKAANEYS